MNKRTFVLLLLSSILSLCSCEKGTSRVLFDDSNKKADERMEYMLEILKDEDRDALKAVFSKQALSDTADFDIKMDTLFDYIHGDVQSFEITGTYGGSDKKEADGRRKKEVQSTYVITTDEQKYEIAIYEYTIDSANPDNVGVYSICIINKDDKLEPALRYWGNGEAGINIKY